MSGILDSKKRILDTIVTQAGRAQLASGDFQIKYVSFTDTDAFYEEDIISGSTDFTKRIYFEACELPQDNVTFEADDSGLLKPFKNSTESDIVNGQIVSWAHVPGTTSVLTGSVREVYATGSAFASLSDTMLDSSVQNFSKLSIIGSHDSLFDDKEFLVSNANAKFVMTNKTPIDPAFSPVTLNVNNVSSLFMDPRLSHITNFKKLTPINNKSNRQQPRAKVLPFSERKLTSQTHDISDPRVKRLMFDLNTYKNMGQCKTISFESTSHDNNLFCQFFEQVDNRVTKLDVIDFGLINTGDRTRPMSHAFFVGKVFLDDNDCHTFIHMFTIVFD
jgi:hypothetical protein